MKKSLLRAGALALSLLFVVTGCKPKHTHNWSTEYAHDTAEHWQTCDGCEEVNNKGAHTFTDKITTPATHMADGVKTYTCSVCGYSYTEKINKLPEHTYNIAKHDETNHWQECECGEKHDVAAHTFGELEVVTPATYEAVGSGKYTCSVCGYEKVVEIDRLQVPAYGAKNHEISVTRALELLAGETLQDNVTVNEYFVEGVITFAKLSTKDNTTYNLDIADPENLNNKIQSYYAANAEGLDASLIVVGNTIKAHGLVTLYNNKTWEFTSTGEIYAPAVKAYAPVVVAENAKVEGLKETYNAGEEATFTVTPNEGLEVKAVNVNGKIVNPEDGTYKVVVGAGLNIVVETQEPVILVEANKTEKVALKVLDNFETYAKEWSTSYTAHEVTFAELGEERFVGTLAISAANKQGATSTIHDRPVGNGKNNTITLSVNGYAIRKVTMKLNCWSESKKFNDIHLEATTDGTTWTAVGENLITAGSALPLEGLEINQVFDKNVIAIRLVVVSANTGSNVQYGLDNIDLRVGNIGEDLDKFDGLELTETGARITYNAISYDDYPDVRIIDTNNNDWHGEGIVVRVKNNTGIDTPLDMQINDVAGNRSYLVDTSKAPVLIGLDGKSAEGTLVRDFGHYVMLPANFDGWMYFAYDKMVNRTDFGAAFNPNEKVWGLFIIINPHYDAYANYEIGAIQVLRDGQFVTVVDPTVKNCPNYMEFYQKNVLRELVNIASTHEHTLTHVDAKAPTATTAGNIEYYYCENCKWYYDKDMNPVTADAVVIPALAATEDLVIYDLTDKVTADLQEAFEIKKYTSAWEDTTASVAIGEAYDGHPAIVLNAWNNQVTFRYSLKYNTTQYFKAIAFTAKADGVSTLRVQLMSSTDGTYATYQLGKLAAGNAEYVIALTDEGWKINAGGQNYTFAQLKDAGVLKYEDATAMSAHFDMINFLVYGESANYEATKIVISDLVFSATKDTTSVTPIVIPVTEANTVLDFEDGTTGSSYDNANWQYRKYGATAWDEWGSAKNQMNARSADGSKNVNITATSTTQQFKYDPKDPIGVVNYVEAKIGNYYNTSVSIKFKASLVDTNGVTHYLFGDANNFFTLEKNTATSYTLKVAKTLEAGIDVDYLIFTTQAASNSFLYLDDIKLLFAAPEVNTNYEPLDVTEGFESYTSTPSCLTKTVSDIYFKNDGKGADGSKNYISIFTTGGNGVVYTLANAGTADKVSFALKNTFDKAVATDVQVDVYDASGNVVGAKKVNLTAGQDWTNFEIELNEKASVVAKVVFTFSPLVSNADYKYCYLDNIVIK